MATLTKSRTISILQYYNLILLLLLLLKIQQTHLCRPADMLVYVHPTNTVVAMMWY